MAWSAPSTRTTGTLITAAIWNQDVVDNPTFLHTRLATLWVNPGFASAAATAVGDWSTSTLLNTAATSAYFGFLVPADFSAVSEVFILYWSSATTTVEYDLYSDYGAAGEAYNANSEQSVNQTVAATADQLAKLSVSAVLTGIAANDFVSVRFATSTGANAASWRVVGLSFEYTRT